MALSNFTELKAAVATWLARSDLTSDIPDFILEAEEDFNNTLRVLQMETRANFSITGEYVTVPNDFLEFRSGYIDGSPRRPMAYLSPDLQTGANGPSNPRSGGKVYFSMAGGSFRFDPPMASLPVDAVILYYAKIPPLASNATNWLLTRAPSLYLYSACWHGSIRIMDDDRAMRAAGLVESLKAKLIASGNRARWGGTSMTMRAA